MQRTYKNTTCYSTEANLDQVYLPSTGTLFSILPFILELKEKRKKMCKKLIFSPTVKMFAAKRHYKYKKHCSSSKASVCLVIQSLVLIVNIIYPIYLHTLT